MANTKRQVAKEFKLSYEPREAFASFHQRENRWAVLICHRRAGKALDVDTPILKTNGEWSTMGALQAGDRIYSEQGEPCKVLQAHPVQHDRPCYKVHFDDGSHIVADEDHLWYTQTKYDRANREGREQVKGQRLSGTAKILKGTVKTTLDIAKTLRARGEANHSIPVTKPLNNNSVTELPIPPYILGAWLGDGHSRAFHITTMDDEIKEEFKDYARQVNAEFKPTKCQNAGKAKTYAISRKDQRAYSPVKALKDLGVYMNKHIPAQYLAANSNDRLAVLQGLMDTDGSIDKRCGRRCEITQKNYSLAQDILTLVRSFGLKAAIKVKLINDTEYYRISFSPPVNPFRLQRKADLFKEPKEAGFGRNFRITAVEQTTSRPVRCITVDSPNKLFLAGKSLVPTHNTVAAVNELVIRALYTQKKNARFAYIAPFRQQAKMIAWLYLREATEGIACDVRESDLSVEFPNGAKISLYGSDNPDAMRGIYNDGVVVDEFADCRPSLWTEVILPTLADRKGWAVLMGTVKGARNQLWQFYLKAKDNDKWFDVLLKATTSGIIDDEELEGLKAQMSEAQFNQEFECDPNAALLGTFYTTLINKIDKEGHINDKVTYDPNFPVTVAADLGRSDSTVLTFFQERPDGIAVIDCEAGFGVGLDYYFELLDNKPYTYDTIWLPHDAKALTLSTNKSTADQFMDKYRGTEVKLDIVPRLSVQDGIEAVRLILPYTWFNSVKCDVMVDALRTYRRKYNELTQAFMDTPLHSWESDFADSARYLAIVANKKKLQAPEAHETAASPYPAYNLADLFADRARGKGNQIQKMRI